MPAWTPSSATCAAFFPASCVEVFVPAWTPSSTTSAAFFPASCVEVFAPACASTFAAPSAPS